MAYAGFYGYRQHKFQSIRSFSRKLKKRQQKLKDRQSLLGELNIDIPSSSIDLMYQFASGLFEPKLQDFAMKWLKTKRDKWHSPTTFSQLVASVELEEKEQEERERDSIPDFEIFDMEI